MRYVIITLMLVSSIITFSREKRIDNSIEICDNAIDDDGDGAIDLNDDDCACSQEQPESLIPNPSFEDQTCCPNDRSQLNCASEWIQASQPTTDYIHSCGFLGWDGIPAPLPYPDGEGIVGFRDGRSIMGGTEPNWKEYAGACLISPLLAGVEYTFEFYIGFVNQTISPPIDITFFGTGSCDNLPFGQKDQFIGCPTNEIGGGWKLLNAVRVSGLRWKLASITVTPTEDIHAIAIGPPCQANTGRENLYYFFDNLVLAQSRYFSKTITDSDNPCTENYGLEISDDPDATYQWYKDGIALVGETERIYKPNLVSGDYAVVEYIGGQCNLSKTFFYRVPTDVSTEKLVICEGESVDFGELQVSSSGIYRDTFLSQSLCDSLAVLDLTVLGESKDTVLARVFEGETYWVESFRYDSPGTYDVNLLSANGCDSLVYLELSNYKLFIPNVFSPNDDGFNDVFEIFIEEVDINIRSLSIYNRWGTRVYNNTSQTEGSFSWRGDVNNVSPDQGVYTYVLELNVGPVATKIISGDVTVVK